MIFWLSLAALAQDDWGEDDDVGFGDFDVVVEEEDTSPPSPFSFGGSARTTESLWVERLSDQPWAKARQSLDLWTRYKEDSWRLEFSGHAEIDFPYWISRDDFDEQTFDTYAWQVLPREALIAVSVGQFEITAGRQLIVWGEGMLLSPVDVVAARDLRDPGLADLEDLRLPVTALRVGWFAGSHRVEVTGVPELDWGFRSSPAGPYGPVPTLLDDNGVNDNPLVAPLFEDVEYAYVHQQDRFALEQVQGFARWRYSGPVDLGLYAASLYDKNGIMTLPDPTDFLAAADAGLIELSLDHRRYAMVGHSGTGGVGDLLFRWEASLDIDRPFNTADLEALVPELKSRRADLVNLMGGVQLAAIPRTTLDFEVAGGVFPKEPQNLLFKANAVTYGFRGAHTALKERLNLGVSALGTGVDLKYGGLVRADASYEIRDGLKAMVGGIVYRPGSENGFLLGLDTHDQVFAQLRYDF